MSSAASLADLGLEPPAPKTSPTTSVSTSGAGGDGASSGGFGFQPGLEGLRGLAVLAVLLYHGGFSWATGGFLGVSTFFTLSGFLITTLLIVEHRRHGGLGFRRFWSRRFRRLLPASLVCLAGVVVFGATVATPEQLVALRGDMLAALFNVANWRFIATDAGYAEQFVAPSPVLHFWSLAIEEQFYLAFPLLVGGALYLARGSRWLLTATFAVAVPASVAYSVSLSARSVDAAYYNTFTRASEILIGALLALALAHPAVEARRATRGGRVATQAGALVALVVCVVAWTSVEQVDTWLYRGGLTVYALLTALVVVGAMGRGPVAALCSTRPLRWLGRISYGVYLYHWPIFLWLTPARTGLAQWPLFGLRLGVTLAVAQLSFTLLEEPIRAGRRLHGRLPLVVAPAAAVVVVVGALWVTADPPTGQVISFEVADQPEVPEGVASQAVAVPSTTTTVDPRHRVPPAPALPAPPSLSPGELPRIYLTGDSGTFTLGVGLVDWAEDNGEASVWNVGRFGCGIGRGGSYRYVGEVRETDPSCNEFSWFEPMAEIRPHVVALMSGTWDVVDRRLEGDDEWRSFGDPAYDQFIRYELTRAVDELQSQGATVVMMTHPRIRTGALEAQPGDNPESDPARMDRYNELVREVAATRSRTVVIDLAAHMADRPNGELDPSERPDGIHWTPDSSRALAEWLGPQLVAAARA